MTQDAGKKPLSKLLLVFFVFMAAYVVLGYLFSRPALGFLLTLFDKDYVVKTPEYVLLLGSTVAWLLLVSTGLFIFYRMVKKAGAGALAGNLMTFFLFVIGVGIIFPFIRRHHADTWREIEMKKIYVRSERCRQALRDAIVVHEVKDSFRSRDKAILLTFSADITSPMALRAGPWVDDKKGNRFGLRLETREKGPRIFLPGRHEFGLLLEVQAGAETGVKSEGPYEFSAIPAAVYNEELCEEAGVIDLAKDFTTKPYKLSSFTGARPQK